MILTVGKEHSGAVWSISSNLGVVSDCHGVVRAVDPDAGAASATCEQVGGLGDIIVTAVDVQTSA